VTARGFVNRLAAIQLPSAFNPYSELCAEHDCTDAPDSRRANLELFLEAAITAGVDTVWIARDLGYRGGRRTGVPLTDEVHLDSVSRLFGGLPVRRATRGPAVAERTAAAVWGAINHINRRVFLWNVFPLHPHEPGQPMSNRCHTRVERETCRPLLLALLDMLSPRRIIAIGRDAQAALADLGIDVVTVRHPSYGGQNEFKSSLFDLYGVKERAPTQGALL
jgi:uracil-DNA glycosylase